MEYLIELGEKALPKILEYQKSGHSDKKLENEIATILLPLAETYARIYESRFRNYSFRTEVDYTECMSKFNQAMVLAIRNSDFNEASSPGQVVGYFKKCFGNGVIDLQRKAGARKKILGRSLDGKISADPSAAFDNRTSEPWQLVEDNGAVRATIEAKLLPLLKGSPQELRAMEIYISGKQRGISNEQMAEIAGMKLETFKSTVFRAAAHIRKGGSDSNIGKEIRKRLLGDDDDGITSRVVKSGFSR